MQFFGFCIDIGTSDIGTSKNQKQINKLNAREMDLFLLFHYIGMYSVPVVHNACDITF